MRRTIVFDPPIDGGVVVGFDDSRPARRALAWGWQEAVVHGYPLHVVRAWTIAGAVTEVGAPAGVVPSVDECAAALLAGTHRALDDVRAAGVGDGKEPVSHLHMVHGQANEVLIAGAARADMIVVGHRSHNLLTHVLGSVARHVLEHARCPVVVFPAG